MDDRILRSDNVEQFISRISSLKLQEIIIFDVSDWWGWGYPRGVESALRELARNSDFTVKAYLIRDEPIGITSHPDEAKFWFDHHPNGAKAYLTPHFHNCGYEFPRFLPELRKDYRVVLMEEREKGTVVVHDSRDPRIHCDCGRDTGKGGRSA